MTRTIDLRDDALLVRYSGFSALLRLTSELRIPYDTIRSVSVGYAGSPGAFTPRIGLNAWPLGARRGMFWIGAERPRVQPDARREGAR